MKRVLLISSLALVALLAFSSSAMAAFGLEQFDVVFKNQDGTPATQAGSHPYEMTTKVYFNTINGGLEPDEEVRNFTAEQITGLVADPTAAPHCKIQDFLDFTSGGLATACPDESAVGYAATDTVLITNFAPVFNLEPPPGVVAKLGFIAANTPVTIEVGLNIQKPFNGTALLTNTPQSVGALSSEVTLWGEPSDPGHDPYRGLCVSNVNQEGPGGLGEPPVIPENYPEPPSYGNCEERPPEVAFLTLPRACEGPLQTTYDALSWEESKASGTAATPLSFSECETLDFAPETEAKTPVTQAKSATGLNFTLDVDDPGLTEVGERADSDIRETIVTLPEGFAANPSAANGLGACSEAQLAKESASSEAGTGCPESSKIGTVEVETPLLDETLKGSLYIATPYDNQAEDSLLALYMVIKSPELGILVAQPLAVEPNPVTGQLTTVAKELPQLPFSHFDLRFREGPRAPLVTPPTCNTYKAKALLIPYAEALDPIEDESTFEITTGPRSGPCPAANPPLASPAFNAGALSSTASAYSPFQMLIARADTESEISSFTVQLPRGMAANFSGVPYCPEAQIATARARTGPHGGAEELSSPSCPAASQIATTLAGAGVGDALTYVPGRVYLAGPFEGAPLSAVAITPAAVGPFDLGNVVIRLALQVDPETAQARLVPSASDPFPRILKGLPVFLREIRASVDRPNFTLNPTSCEAKATTATIAGPGGQANVSAPFEASNCAALAFRPKIAIKLKGATKRTGHPALHSTVTYPYPSGPGYSNIARAAVTLPSSEFIDPERVANPCTREQFAANACPKDSILGRAKAITPILDAPLEGNVYFRSNGGARDLPDIVADLKGQFRVILVGYVDAVVKGEVSRVRTTFAQVPDAPVTSFQINLKGGKEGLLVNSANLCKATRKIDLKLTAQNGRRWDTRPVMGTSCKKAKKKGKGGK
jgi:hypothetical protein